LGAAGGIVRAYIIGRIVAVLPTILMLLFSVVVLVQLLPGDALDVLEAQSVTQGSSVTLSDADRSAIEKRLGLDKSLPEEYVSYTFNAFQGDLGKSIWSREPVLDMIGRALPVTLIVSLMALLWATALGIFTGVISAARQGSWLDYVLRSISILGLSIPSFALATSVIVGPTLWWKWSPPVFYTSFTGNNLWTYISQFFTPAFVLGLGLSAIIMRLSRTQLVEVLRQDYIRTARAKGINERGALLRHALPNSLIPVVSQLGLQVGTLLSGAVIIESIFGLPGMGRLLLSAVAERNYPVIQGVTLVSGLFVIVLNLLVDISYGYLNPRLRAH